MQRTSDSRDAPRAAPLNRKRVALTLSGLALGPAIAAAQVTRGEPAHSHASIRLTAEAAVRASLPSSTGAYIVTAAALDPRLRLAACSTPLAAAAAPLRAGQSRTLVSVKCDGSSPWTWNVPVSLEIEQRALVARVPIARGAALSAADITQDTRRVPGITTRYLSDPIELQHRVARRPIAPGEALSIDALMPAKLIQRGQQVTLVAQVNGVTIRAPGRALTDAGAHQRVRVQNLQSLSVIEGIATSVDTVQVGGNP